MIVHKVCHDGMTSQYPFGGIFEQAGSCFAILLRRKLLLKSSLMRIRLRVCIIILAMLLFSCNRNTGFYIKNLSYTNQQILTVITIDDTVIMSDSLKYDSSEYGHVVLKKILKPGTHLLKVNLPGKGMTKTEQIDDLKKYVYITIGDNKRKADYRLGDLYISIAVMDKDPYN
jgi:hypothetical protein